MKNHLGKIISAVIVLLIILYGFWIYKSKEAKGKILTVWTQPGNKVELFWKEVVKEWNDKKLGMHIYATPIPQAQSSEEAVLTAVAAGTAPDICDNIFIGFAAQLNSINSVYPLNEFPGYDDVIKSMHLEDTIDFWKIDGNVYVIPLYCNPILYWWRMDILKKYGFTKVPETYSDFIKIAEKTYIPYKQWPIIMIGGKTWPDRWTDFIPYYYAASGGKPYIIDNRPIFDNKIGHEVLDLFKKTIDNGWTLRTNDGWQDAWNGKVIGALHSPSDIAYGNETYPGFIEKIKVGPILVPDNLKGPHYTMADSKGLVILKTAKYPEQAWKFLKWVFSHPKFARLWLEKTDLPPYRGDLLTNPLFLDYYKKNPIAFEYAKYIKYAVPCAPTPDTIDVQEAMTNYIIQPLQAQIVTVDQALANCVRQINKLLKPYQKEIKYGGK